MALKLRRGNDAQRAGITLADGELAYSKDTRQLWIGDGVTQGGNPVVGTNIVGFGLSYDAITQKIEVAGLTTDDISEGTNNKYFSASLAQSAASQLFVNGTHTGITFVYNDLDQTINAEITAADLVGIMAVSEDTSPVLGGTLDLDGNNITGTGDINIIGNITGTNLIGVINTNSILSDTTDILIGTYSNRNNLILFADENNPGITVKSTLIGTPGLEQLGPIIRTYAFAGTEADPEALAIGDSLGQINFQGKINAGSFGLVDADLASIKTKINNPGNLVDTVATGTLQFIVLNGPDPEQVKVAEFNNDGVFTAPILQPGSYSSVERDALTANFGMIIYNTDTNKFQGYQNTGGTTPEWVDLS